MRLTNLRRSNKSSTPTLKSREHLRMVHFLQHTPFLDVDNVQYRCLDVCYYLYVYNVYTVFYYRLRFKTSRRLVSYLLYHIWNSQPTSTTSGIHQIHNRLYHKWNLFIYLLFLFTSTSSNTFSKAFYTIVSKIPAKQSSKFLAN